MMSLPAMSGVEFKSFSQNCEEALALSALPKKLRSQASVHVLKSEGFIKTIHSEGGYNCLVERNHAESIIPQCVTPSGSDNIFPALKFRTLKTRQGHTADEINQMFEEAVLTKKFVVPDQPGINYMMSAFNHIYVEKRQSFRDVGPHIMVFAPHVTDEDIGGSIHMAMKNKGYPFVGQSGAHGYIISMVEHASDSQQVLSACDGQL